MSGPNSTEVEYRDIPGFPGYLAGSDGTIWSSKFTGCHGRRTADYRIRALRSHPAGHLRLKMHGKNQYVHRLIAATFIGPCPPGKEVCHNDGNPKNNKASNLRYGTRSENVLDYYRNHGGMSKRLERKFPRVKQLGSAASEA